LPDAVQPLCFPNRVQRKAAFVLAAVLFAVWPVAAHRPAAVVRSITSGGDSWHVSGVVHVHSRASDDASGTLDDIARAARRAGLDFVVVTDHNTEDSLGPPRYRDGVLMIGGLEKSTDAGHLLVLGLHELPFRLDGDPAAVVRDVMDLGGFVVVAHPTSGHAERRWTGDLRGISGIEFVSLGDAETWTGGPHVVLAAARYGLDPQGALFSRLRIPRAAFAPFDRENARRPIAGILGSDAHGGLPSHDQVFRLARQHLVLDAPLTGDAIADETAVLHALREGRGYAAFDGLADASEFRFQATSGASQAVIGGALALDGSADLVAEASAPLGTTLVLLRDGLEVARGTSLRHTTSSAGSYRVEAYLDPERVPGRGVIPWIVSNPIDVYPREVLDARARGSEETPSLDAALPDGGRTLDDFESPALAPAWQVDRSPDSDGHLTRDDGGLRFDFRLGPGRTSHVSFCAFEPRDLAAAQALAFRVRADRRLRFDVQVRVADATAAPGVRVFRRSVRAETEWRRTGVGLHDLKSYDALARVPDLAQVTGLYFHIDAAHLAAGSTGTLWIDDLQAAP
jgi:hypothetical protein